MIDPFRGFKIVGRKGLGHWSALLEEWLLSIERYARIMEGYDSAYSYNERANVGILSGAAWRCGRIALEEFQVKKGYRNRQKKYGRCDLWISDEIREEFVEAKFRRVSLQASDIRRDVDSAMLEAVNDAKRTRGNDREILHLGIGFFAPQLTSSTFEKLDGSGTLDREISNFVSIILTANYHFAAWCFPREAREPNDDDPKYYYPGVIMLGINIAA